MIAPLPHDEGVPGRAVFVDRAFVGHAELAGDVDRDFSNKAD